jgi:hypothetical protein
MLERCNAALFPGDAIVDASFCAPKKLVSIAPIRSAGKPKSDSFQTYVAESTRS